MIPLCPSTKSLFASITRLYVDRFRTSQLFLYLPNNTINQEYIYIYTDFQFFFLQVFSSLSLSLCINMMCVSVATILYTMRKFPTHAICVRVHHDVCVIMCVMMCNVCIMYVCVCVCLLRLLYTMRKFPTHMLYMCVRTLWCVCVCVSLYFAT